MTNKDIIKQAKFATDNSVKCKHCGHSVLITNRYKRVICNWCGHYVYTNKKEEFKYKLREKMKNENMVHDREKQQ